MKQSQRIKKNFKKRGAALYRIIVFRSSKHIKGQVLEIKSGKTLFSETDSSETGKQTKIEKAKTVGKKLGQKIKKAKLENLFFDRNGYKFHGRVKAIAEALKEEGVKI